jgi:hypothetical protein
MLGIDLSTIRSFLVVCLSFPLFCCALAQDRYSYALVDAYQGPGFFDNFNFFDEPDPTHGFVKYEVHILCYNFVSKDTC